MRTRYACGRARESLSRPGTGLAAGACLALAAAACSPAGGGVRRDALDDADLDPHVRLFAQDRYPAATACRPCHAGHYEEWSVSPHAYAQLSPIFNAMHGTILRGTSGTLGDFCIRCHTPVGMALGEPLFASNLERSAVALEGVTCIVCHRVNRNYGKNNARNAIVPGEIFAPVYGPRDGSEQRRVVAHPEEFGPVATAPDMPGRNIHAEASFFEPLSRSESCGTCHEILLSGFREDETLSEYKSSPASGRGESCQDCHMGTVQGAASGYARGPAARLGSVETAAAKRTDHMFPGPDHSLVHPGIFPHNPDLAALASMEEWLAFDYDAGWGTDEFEDAVTEETVFPERWSWAEDRYEARELLEGQVALLARAREKALELMRNGFELGPIRTRRADASGIAFDVDVRNVTDGHNAPTGFIGERQVFLQVTVTDADGRVVFRSGDLDPNGDLREPASRYVAVGQAPRDRQLFTLSSKFLTRNVRGGEREQPLPLNFSPDPLPYVRPTTLPATLYGRNFNARIHKRSIEPGGRRTASYEVPAEELTGRPPYRAEVRLVVGMIPVNLIAAIQGVGFDYGLSSRELAERVVAGHFVVATQSASIEPR